MFFSILLNIGALAGDIFINIALSKVIEIITKVLVFVLIGLKGFGRRRTMIGFLCLAGIVSLLRVVMIELGKFNDLMIACCSLFRQHVHIIKFIPLL